MRERHQVVQAALDQVRTLRKTEFRGEDDQVLTLLHSYSGDASPANSLWADLPTAAAVEDIADLLSLWLWRTDDNGAQIMRAVENWITEHNDPKKIEVSLSLEAYPFIDDLSRIEALERVKVVFPEFSPRCQEIIDQSKNWMNNRAAR